MQSTTKDDRATTTTIVAATEEQRNGIKLKWLKRKYKPHNDQLSNYENEGFPMSRPIFMVGEMHYGQNL
jgi:hypothetical protein